MGYEITGIDQNVIHVRFTFRDELDGFIMLLKSIEGDLDGRILQLDGDEIKYVIDKDPYKLVYKWDTVEGISIILNDIKDTEAVTKMLYIHFEKLS